MSASPANINLISDDIQVEFNRPKSINVALSANAKQGATKRKGTLTPKMAAGSNLKVNEKSSLGGDLWSLMRQQVFLGLTASSVPIKQFIKDIKEDLTQAGVRFVYFSPRNMRGSIPVAKKIGIEYDWNFAISLRPLDENKHDPHRYIR